MTEPKKEAPAGANSQGSNTINRLTIVSVNHHPRQRWRGSPPRKRIPISTELMADFSVLIKKWGSFDEY